MRKIKFHWWVLLGIVSGALIGTLLNHHFSPEAQQLVFGNEVSAADLQTKAKELNETLSKLVKASWFGGALDGIARIFMNLLKMIVLPLVFFSLVQGISGMKGIKDVGRIGIKTAGWYMFSTIMAITTGMLVVNLIAPGQNAHVVIPTTAREIQAPESFWDVLVNMVPANPIQAAASNPPNMFGVVLFALMFAIFLTTLNEDKKRPMVDLMESGTSVMMKMTGFIISLAPVGIMAMVSLTVATTGPKIFITLLPYVITVFVGLGVHALISLPTLLWLFTRRNPFQYMRAMSGALLTGFSTASSAGALAITMEHAQTKAGISNRMVGFVLPMGSTMNMDGTALYECVTVMFIAQLHAATHPEFAPLTLGGQLTVVLMSLLVCSGAPAIPHAGLVMMVIILNAVGLPLEYTALVWAVDRVLDMTRTTVNMWSDLCGLFVISHSENEIDESVLIVKT